MAQQRKRIVAGNWKMHGSRAFARELIPALLDSLGASDARTEVILLPPAILVGEVRELLQARSGEVSAPVNWGVQNLAAEPEGAFTGEISAAMAVDQECTHCLLGHSERRQLFGETDTAVAEKVRQALTAGLKVIVCVGETLAQHEAGEASAIVAEQVKVGLAKVPADHWHNVIVAYEPVWAIGTGKTASAEDAQAIHASIRRTLEHMQAPANSISLLYGGSVKPDNAEELFAQPDIDGGLIGGASLDAESFAAICRAC